MNTYLILSRTNYGETVVIINAPNEAAARTIADSDNHVWDGYLVELLDTTTIGSVAYCGGDSG